MTNTQRTVLDYLLSCQRCGHINMISIFISWCIFSWHSMGLTYITSSTLISMKQSVSLQKREWISKQPPFPFQFVIARQLQEVSFVWIFYADNDVIPFPSMSHRTNEGWNGTNRLWHTAKDNISMSTTETLEKPEEPKWLIPQLSVVKFAQVAEAKISLAKFTPLKYLKWCILFIHNNFLKNMWEDILKSRMS